MASFMILCCIVILMVSINGVACNDVDIQELNILAAEPTAAPTDTAMPTESPTVFPTPKPTRTPTANPTTMPTRTPSRRPTRVPTAVPTDVPTAHPTDTSSPSEAPTPRPSTKPTRIPTAQPTIPAPSAKPTRKPTPVPTILTDAPTAVPTDTSMPTEQPTPKPSAKPTRRPTASPTTAAPTAAPSRTRRPSAQPTVMPTEFPTLYPTEFPTAEPLILAVPQLPSASSCWSDCLQQISVQLRSSYCDFYRNVAMCRSGQNVSHLLCIPQCMQALSCASEYCSVFSGLSAMCETTADLSPSKLVPVVDHVRDECQYSIERLSDSLNQPDFRSPFQGLKEPIKYIVFNISISFLCSPNCTAGAFEADSGAIDSLKSTSVAFLPGTSISTIELLAVEDMNAASSAGHLKGSRGLGGRRISPKPIIASSMGTELTVVLRVYTSLSTILNVSTLSNNLTTIEPVYQELLQLLKSAIEDSNDFNNYWLQQSVPAYCSYLDASTQEKLGIWCSALTPPNLLPQSLKVPEGGVPFEVTTNPRIYNTNDDAGGSSGGGADNTPAIIGGVVGGTAAVGVGAVAYKIVSDNANSIRAPMSAVGDFDIPLEGL